MKMCVSAYKTRRVNRPERRWSGMRFAVVRVSPTYLRALYSEQCIEQRRPTWNVVRFSRVCASARARAHRRQRALRYSSRFLSLRNALAIIAART